MRFTVNYHEGAAVGYKWFDLKGHKPLFPFGHGLSYTSFAYSGFAGEHHNGKVTVRFKVTNTGAVKGADAPQIYVAPLGVKWEAPKRLAGWEKLELNPGESREVSVTLEPRTFAMYHSRSKTWRTAKGKYKLMLAQDAGADGTSITVDLPASTMDVRGNLSQSQKR
jgi:beta-glucosidase